MAKTILLYPLLFLCMLPYAQILFGIVYLNECPRQPYIPIYLIVMGAFCLISLFSSLSHYQEDVTCLFYCKWHSLMFFFYPCWLITGDVWIYSIYEPNYNKTMTDVEPYCDKTVYLFAFCTTTLSSTLYLLLVCYGCYCIGRVAHELRNDDSED